MTLGKNKIKNVSSYMANNYKIITYSIIIALSFGISYKLLYCNPIFDFVVGEGPNQYLQSDSEILRQFLLFHMIWAFIKVFLIWMVTFALLFLVKNTKLKKSN